MLALCRVVTAQCRQVLDRLLSYLPLQHTHSNDKITTVTPNLTTNIDIHGKTRHTQYDYSFTLKQDCTTNLQQDMCNFWSVYHRCLTITITLPLLMKTFTMQPSPRKPHYALHPIHLSVCPVSTKQYSNFEMRLPMSGVAGRAIPRRQGQRSKSLLRVAM